MAENQSERTLEKSLGAVDEIFQAVEQFRERRASGSPENLSREELDQLTKRLNAMGKVNGQIQQDPNGETRIDVTLNGVRTRVAVPTDPDQSVIEQTLANVQARTKAADLFTLGVLGGEAAATFSQEERDRFLELMENRKELKERFSQAIEDHPAFRKKAEDIWANLDKGESILQREDWRQQLGLISESADVKNGVDALKNDAIRQARFISFVRDMESHRSAFHNAANTAEQTGIVIKAEERIAAYSKSLPLSEKAEVRKQSLGFIKAVEAKKNALKQLFKRKLQPPAIGLGAKRGFSH